MTPEEFKEFSSAATDFIADYLSKDCRTVDVLPSVKPGYLHKRLPLSFPEDPMHWRSVFKDFKLHIMPGMTHYQSPNFHAFFPSGASYSSIIGELISAGLGNSVMTWMASPAGTELEIILLDWLVKFLNLPKKFLSEGHGGGVLHSGASESILMAIATAREMIVGRADDRIRGHIVMYTSDSANLCVEKGGKLAGVKVHIIKTGDDNVMTGKLLEAAITEDLAKGWIPCICVATFGTTNFCALDEIDNLSVVCKRYKMFIHVDAAYAGAALCLPDYSNHAKAFQNVDSLNINLHKLMNTNYENTAMWFSDVRITEKAFHVDAPYVSNELQEGNPYAKDLRLRQIALGRRPRALRVWLTYNIMGCKNIRDEIQHRFMQAEYFNQLLKQDSRITIVHKARLGLVTFQHRDGNGGTRELHKRLTESKQIFLSPTMYKDKLVIRYLVGGYDPQKEDVEFAVEEIRKQLNAMDEKESSKKQHASVL